MPQTLNSGVTGAGKEWVCCYFPGLATHYVSLRIFCVTPSWHTTFIQEWGINIVNSKLDILEVMLRVNDIGVNNLLSTCHLQAVPRTLVMFRTIINGKGLFNPPVNFKGPFHKMCRI